MTKVLGLCGSLRGDSWNLKLLRSFLEQLAQKEPGWQLQAYPDLNLPLMNEDLEKKPLDEKILRLRKAIEESQIIVVASPEYNASFSPALKNAIDWATRPPGNLWVGKVVVLLAASPGALGGARGLIQLRTVLSGIKAWIIPEQVQLPLADQAFSPEGKLANPQALKQIDGAIVSLQNFYAKVSQK
jgi:chromate reductase